jgi:DNA mismatch repair protein MutS2
MVKRVFQPGDAVQTSFGKGRVRAVENGGRLIVEIRQRTLVIAMADVQLIDRDPLDPPSTTPSRPSADEDTRVHRQIDLHGLTVEEALARIDQELSDALLAGASELRFIHGRSGGRVRGALHRRLREISSVRAFAIDPRNEGVTVVRL